VRVLKIEYEGRVFGDVLQDIIYSTSENTYDFMRLTGITNIKISHFVNHKSWPGIVSLRKISKVLPESEQQKFILHFMNKDVKKECISILKSRNIKEPYSYVGHYDRELIYDEKYFQTDKEFLRRLRIQGLFKYLTDEEKTLFKENLIRYIITRNEAMKEALGAKQEGDELIE
jgi:hypothetical protein